MYKIRLNDGTEFPARFCSARGGILTIGITTTAEFYTVATKFCQQGQSVTFCYDGTEERYVGYTRVLAINGATAGEYQIMMEKE